MGIEPRFFGFNGIMRTFGTYLLFVTLSLFTQTENLFAQNGKQKIAVFAPLYLDSAFDATNGYRYDKTFPKFLNPGLEFFEGIQLALDSLDKENMNLEVFVFDTRSSKTLLQEQLNGLDSVGLIIEASLALTASAAMAARPCPPGTHPQRATAGPGPPVFSCVANP